MPFKTAQAHSMQDKREARSVDGSLEAPYTRERERESEREAHARHLRLLCVVYVPVSSTASLYHNPPLLQSLVYAPLSCMRLSLLEAASRSRL
jgi:hypothetical protein